MLHISGNPTMGPHPLEVIQYVRSIYYYNNVYIQLFCGLHQVNFKSLEVLFLLMLNIPVNIFSVILGRFLVPGLNQYPAVDKVPC